MATKPVASWTSIVLTVVSSLLVAAILAGWRMSSDVAALRQRLDDRTDAKDLGDIKQMIADGERRATDRMNEIVKRLATDETNIQNIQLMLAQHGIFNLPQHLMPAPEPKRAEPRRP